ncbi:MAG: hypothetical protein CMB89_01230 [Flammeovirgaceae bacterium]|nr:hypothetical protein [Flammeovirgaceae bacterium]MBR11213.1 hypothetical protein [Rickettsiales bacterium]HCX23817.1 hypothetical protein [Cytophagales bacterium]
MTTSTLSVIFNALVISLILLGIVVIIMYPKEVVRGFFNSLKPRGDSVRSWIFLPIWIVGKLIEKISNFKIYDPE